MDNTFQNLKFTETSEVMLRGNALKLFHYFDEQFLEFAKKFGAEEYYFPTYLPLNFLRKIEYLESFPQLAIFTAHLNEKVAQKSTKTLADLKDIDQIKKQLTFSQNLLSRAVCYHYFYHLMKSGKISKDTLVATSVSRCFRQEHKTSPDRLRGFTMREIVFVGSTHFVEGTRNKLIDRIKKFVQKLGFPFTIDQAQDPFFTARSRGKYLLQKLKPLKYELCVQVKNREPSAITSFNNHEDFFTKRLNIKLNVTNPHSGCVAFGLERWVLTFLNIYGENEDKWPDLSIL